MKKTTPAHPGSRPRGRLRLGRPRLLVVDCGDIGGRIVARLARRFRIVALTSSPERPRVVSLLPRVHLAILTPRALRADLHQAFAEAKSQGYSVLVSGPSRTADIELTLTLGVHGPKSLHVWVLDEA